MWTNRVADSFRLFRCALLLLPFDDAAMEGVTFAAAAAAVVVLVYAEAADITLPTMLVLLLLSVVLHCWLSTFVYLH